jgi:hypothetical protein
MLGTVPFEGVSDFWTVQVGAWMADQIEALNAMIGVARAMSLGPASPRDGNPGVTERIVANVAAMCGHMSDEPPSSR